MQDYARRLIRVSCIIVFAISLLVARLINVQLIDNKQYSKTAIQVRSSKVADEYVLRGVITDRNYRDLSDSGWSLSKENPKALPEYRRYGEHPLAVHVVGHLDPSQKTGSKGVEAWFNNVLKAPEESGVFAEKDVKGRIVPGKGAFIYPPVSSTKNNVVLTIDREIQKLAEDVSSGIVNKEVYLSNGAVVVLDIESGDLLAIVSRPSFNPNKPLADINNNLINKAFNFYYPGSVFKIVTAAAAYEEGLVSTKERFYCDGRYNINSSVYISCWDKNGHGEQTFTEAFANSCNPTFISIGQRLGKAKLQGYIHKFALDEQEIIGYPYIEGGNISIGGGKAALANASIGQEGIKLTPVQIATIIAAVARDGKHIKPRLVKEIRQFNGPVQKIFSTGTPEDVISMQTASKMQKLMHEVTTSGTGTNAWLPLGSAGKTGSAQTGERTAQGEEKVHAWFAGYVPFAKPKYAIVVFSEEGKYGGKAAAPVFKEIAQHLLQRKE